MADFGGNVANRINMRLSCIFRVLFVPFSVFQWSTVKKIAKLTVKEFRIGEAAEV